MTWQPDPKDVAAAAEIVVRELGPKYLRSCGLEDRALMVLAVQWKAWHGMSPQQRAALTALACHRIDHPDQEPPTLTDPPPRPWLGRATGLAVGERDTLVTYWELLQELGG